MADNKKKEERANFYRLATLLVDVGSKVLRNVLQEDVKPKTVEDVLKAERSEIDKYYKGIKKIFKGCPKILNDEQYALLTVNLDPMEFDITLLVFIFRNVRRIAPPKLWEKRPDKKDLSLAANIQRLQEKRNVIYGHVSSTRIESGRFENTWNDLSNIIRHIAELQSENFDVEINELKCQSLDPCDKTDVLLEIIKDWQQQDELFKAEVIEHLQHQDQVLNEILRKVVGNAQDCCKDVTTLTKSQLGMILIKRCFESCQTDTLTYSELSQKLNTFITDIKDEKIRCFNDISGLSLTDFLTLNETELKITKKKGMRRIKLKADTKSRKQSTKFKLTDDLKSEKESQKGTLQSYIDLENRTDIDDASGNFNDWTTVVRGKKKPITSNNDTDMVSSTGLSYAKVHTSQNPTHDYDLDNEKFKRFLQIPVDRDHIFKSDINVYKHNKLAFMLDIVSMLNTPQRTNSYIVLGVEESDILPHKLVGLQDYADDCLFQSLFEDGYFTMKPKFKYHEIREMDRVFGYIEIGSSYGYGQPCIVKMDARQDFTVLKENDMWFRQGKVNKVCEPIDPTTVSLYQWFNGERRNPNPTNEVKLQSSVESGQENVETSTNGLKEAIDFREELPIDSFDHFWKQVQSFQRGNFVLISGDVHNQHRRLEALSLVPWLVVYDFNIHSASDGLLNATKDSIERKRSLHLTTWCDVPQCLSEEATSWCFLRGRREISETRTDEKKGEVEDALVWFKRTKDGIIANCEQLAGFSEDYTVITMVIIWPETEKMIPILQKFICHLNEHLASPPRIVVILTKEPASESAKRRIEIFREDYKGTIAVCKIEIETVCIGIMSKMKNYNQEKRNLSLPTADGQNDLSLSHQDAAWLKEDLDVLYIDNHYSFGKTDETEVQEAIDAFYRGVPLHWRIRYGCTSNQIDIERDKMKGLEAAVATHVENYKTVVITLYHSPGSGGTTLAQSVLWKFHLVYPCVHLKLRSTANVDELCRRVSFLNKKTQLPIILLIDGEEESKVLYLSKRLHYAIIIYVKRYPYKIQNDVNASKLFLKGYVSQAEAAKLSAKFGENCENTKKEALERLSEDVQSKKQDHHLYEFGLTRFHHEFHGIVSFVQGYLQLKLNPSKELLHWQRCLGYLALIYFYSQASVPCQFFAKLMNKLPDYSLSLDDFPHEFTQFVTYDRNQGKKDCIRICHDLVAKEVLEQILSRHTELNNTRTDNLGQIASRNLSKFCIEFIEYAGGKKTRSSTQPSTIKFILTKTFIFREDSRETGDSEDQKRKRPQLSKLLMDIPSDQPLFKERLDVLVKLTSSFPEDPNFLAHLGRFYAFCRPNDEHLAEKYSKKAVDLCQKLIEGKTLESVDDSTKLTLMHVYHMYANIKRKGISRYTGWSENDRAPVRTKTNEFEGRLEELVNLAETACVYYKKSRDATPENHCAYVYAYTDEIKVRLQICEFVKKQQRKQSGSEQVASLFESEACRPAKAFIARSVHIIENLIMECYMDFELLNGEIQTLQHLVMWYNNLFKEKAIAIEIQLQPNDDDISNRCLQIALIKLKYGAKSTFGNIQNVTDKDDVNQIVHLLEEIFEQTEKYGFTGTYGKHELERDFRDWIYAIRHDSFQKDYDVENVLSTLQLWQNKTNSPLSHYYNFIIKSLLGFGSDEEPGKTECLMDAETCKENLTKMKRLIIKPKYPREWLGRHGKGVRRLLSGKRFIGNNSLTENESMGFHGQSSALAVCKGTILPPNTNRIGSYVAYDLGVNTVKVFFLPKIANLEGSRYVGHRVEFNLAFSIEHGYEAYNVVLLKYYGCPNCSAKLEFTAEATELYCKCGTPVYKDDLNESKAEMTDF